MPDWLAEFNRKVDECAALRREVETLADVSRSIIEGLEIENKRLKSAHNGEVCVDTMEYCDKLKAKNERLREAAEPLAARNLTGGPAGLGPHRTFIAVTPRELGNLRAALATGEKGEGDG